MKISLCIPVLALALLFVAACGTTTDLVMPVLPHDPVNEGWKAIENYQHSFNTQNTTLLDESLASEFEFLLSEEDWDDYNGDGIVDTTLTEQMYLTTISALFDSTEVIELTLTGTVENPWTGDPTGQTMQYLRSYNMKAYNWVGGQQEGWTRQGEASFLCKADSSGVWRITYLEDLTGSR